MRASAIGALVLLACLSVPVPAVEEHYDAQGSGVHSTLIDKDGTGIKDETFAGWIKDLVFTSANPPAARVRNCIFVMEQCYSGGMLDDLITVFANSPSIPWIGGSAARHNEMSYGQYTPAEGGNCQVDYFNCVSYDTKPSDFWTRAGGLRCVTLAGTLSFCDQAVITSVNNARASDPAGVNCKGWEHSQSVCRNSAENITIKDSGASKHYAILWAGKTNRIRFYNDITAMRDSLLYCWGSGSDVSITILFGDGSHKTTGGSYNSETLPSEWNAQAATSTNLQNAISNLKTSITPSDQFLFYSSDHGGTANFMMLPGGLQILPGGYYVEPFDTPFGEYQGIYLELTNQPTLTAEYTGQVVAGAVQIRFNNVPLGTLNPSTTKGKTVFPVPESLIVYPTNQVTIQSGSPFPFTMDVLDFFTGGIAPDPSISPSAAKLFGNGSRVGPGGVVTLDAFSDFFYIEEPDRSSGIRVLKTGHGLVKGQQVDVLGTINTNADGERYVQADLVHAASVELVTIDPLGTNNRALGGDDWLYVAATGSGQMGFPAASGLNNIGLLVRAWGRVTARDPSATPTWFVMDDGSGLGVKIEVPAPLPAPGLPEYVGVTGVSSCEALGGVGLRKILVRGAGDISRCWP